MAKLLLGREVNEALQARLTLRVRALAQRGIVPTLALVRLGDDPADVSYETGACKGAELLGIEIKKYLLPEHTDKETLLQTIHRLNEDESIHGVLLFRPLPPHLREHSREICNALRPEKDVDCMTERCSAGVFAGGQGKIFAPCTPEACMAILDHYGFDCTGKHAVVIGRSQVVGKPVAMLLLERNATVTLCHSKTRNLPELCRSADLIVTAAGALGSLTAQHVRPGQVIVDVSINFDPKKPNGKGTLGALAGDADFSQVEPVVQAITPVPGGVGAVTTTVLMAHVIEAAER